MDQGSLYSNPADMVGPVPITTQRIILFGIKNPPWPPFDKGGIL